MTRFALLIVIGSLLAGCSLFKGKGETSDVIFDDNVGPDTKQLLRTLPGGLSGDAQNARHTNETLRGDE